MAAVIFFIIVIIIVALFSVQNAMPVAISFLAWQLDASPQGRGVKLPSLIEVRPGTY